MVIGLLQLNSTVGDFAANQKKLLDGYGKAVALGAEFILAPELFLCGYPPRDLLLREDFILLLKSCHALKNETAKNVGAIPLCVGYVDRNPEKPGCVIAKFRRSFAERKNHLANEKKPAADL